MKCFSFFGKISLDKNITKGGFSPMLDYTKITYQIKEKVLNFSAKISKSTSKPFQKFIFQMFYGMLESNSVLLSDIARALKEKIALIKVINRISRNLNNFIDGKLIWDNYIHQIKHDISDNTIFCVDDSDITKRKSQKLEALCKVRDGSTGQSNVNGYKMFEIAAITKNFKMPIPVYTKIYSSLEKNFESQNSETLEGLDYVRKTFNKKGIFTLDRGFDADKYFEYFCKWKLKFVIRCQSTRNVILDGLTMNILDCAKRAKAEYSCIAKLRNGQKKRLYFTYLNISLPCLPGTPLGLVVVKGIGEKPMMLITNLKADSQELTYTVLKIYVQRWKIEEYFKFKKQQFDLENLRVRSLNSIRNLNLLLTILVGFIAHFSENAKGDGLYRCIIKLSNRVFKVPRFDYYAIADGIFNILKYTKTGIEHMYKYRIKDSCSEQTTLFHPYRYNVFNQIA